MFLIVSVLVNNLSVLREEEGRWRTQTGSGLCQRYATYAWKKRAVIFKSCRPVTHNMARDLAAPQTCCIPVLIPHSTITSWNSSKPERRSQGTSCCPCCSTSCMASAIRFCCYGKEQTPPASLCRSVRSWSKHPVCNKCWCCTRWH